jgi:hypothetical protein
MQIKKCRRIFSRVRNESGCSHDCDASRDISAQLGVCFHTQMVAHVLMD